MEKKYPDDELQDRSEKLEQPKVGEWHPACRRGK